MQHAVRFVLCQPAVGDVGVLRGFGFAAGLQSQGRTSVFSSAPWLAPAAMLVHAALSASDGSSCRTAALSS